MDVESRMSGFTRGVESEVEGYESRDDDVDVAAPVQVPAEDNKGNEEKKRHSQHAHNVSLLSLLECFIAPYCSQTVYSMTIWLCNTISS